MSDGQNLTVDGHVPPPPPGPSISDPLINMVIDGRYRVISRMARGGMATVYIARDERLDRLVALKVMHPHLAESEQFTARFRREARSAAKISHPGVVPIYDQGVVEGQGYLVMELVDGPDLRTYLLRHSPITLATALNFTEQLLDSLGAAHRAGVVHRDLKPENVLVADDDSLRIVDFGLARAASEVSVSTTGSIMGTVAYLAPEVALHGTSDARTDIFAVGVMLYEMLTGTLPGSNENPVQVALSRVNEDFPPPSEQTDWLPVEIDNLVASLCARDPAERPSTARDAAAMVRHARDAMPEEILSTDLPVPVGARQHSSAIDLTIPVGKHGRTSILPIEELVVQTSGSIVAPQDKQFPPQSRRWLIVVTIVMLVAAVALGTWWWWQQYGPGSYVVVPDLSGMSVAQAEAELADLEMASSISHDYSDAVAVDLVIRTDPAAGDRVHRTDEIDLVVSLGVKMIDVPQVEGSTPDEATTTITQAGLRVGGHTDEWSETVEEGIVIGTQPAAGENVRHDQQITLLVSKGREPIDVPSVVNQPLADATATIEGLGLQVASSEEFSDTVDEGTVIRQDPAAGDTRHRGDTITLVVSKGPELVEVPNVYGRSKEDAITVLEQAGFQVKVETIVNFFNTVGNQTPSGGEMARRGSTVTIQVA